jgi:hypothetical protein
MYGHAFATRLLAHPGLHSMMQLQKHSVRWSRPLTSAFRCGVYFGSTTTTTTITTTITPTYPVLLLNPLSRILVTLCHGQPTLAFPRLPLPSHTMPHLHNVLSAWVNPGCTQHPAEHLLVTPNPPSPHPRTLASSSSSFSRLLLSCHSILRCAVISSTDRGAPCSSFTCE